jgi:thymidylate synthase (FAD)
MLDTNEVSRRYVDEPPSFYYPTTYRSRPEGSIKQGSNPTPVTHLPKWVYYEETSDFTEQELIDEANNLATITQIFTRLSSTMYQSLVAANVAPEQARFFLLQSMETTFIATTSATYWSRILAARTDPHAQQEIQDSANQIHSLLTQTYPSFI